MAALPELGSLSEYAVFILNTDDCDKKSEYTDAVWEMWRHGRIAEIGTAAPPARPSRPSHVQVLPAGKMPKRQMGTPTGRSAMIHSLVHIESVAIDLSWDIVCRFTSSLSSLVLPREFYSDWIKVAADEAKHYRMLKHRLNDMGSAYGDFPVHDGLWESAMETSSSLLARLAVEHMVHEARGLDVTPNTIHKFASAGDNKSAAMLRAILQDEVTHVAAGKKWFVWLLENGYNHQHKRGDTNAATAAATSFRRPHHQVFEEVVRQHYRGTLKPPFNTEARAQAGLTEEWYLPLSTPAGTPPTTPATVATTQPAPLATPPQTSS